MHFAAILRIFRGIARILHVFCGKCGKITGVGRTIAAGGGSNTKTGVFDAMAESAGWMFWM